jgi:DNA mismatch repair protein MutS
MRQYRAIKEQHPDSLVFYRLGDFYELFGDDAVIASKELGLVLTKRQDTPMCGVPWHASDMYLMKLIKNGHTVAICEQMETPEEAKKRGGAKTTVERSVTRVVTQGTLTEQSMLTEKNNNFLLAISDEANDSLGIAYADVSTGLFFVEDIRTEELSSTLSKVIPAEIVCPDCLLSKRHILDSLDKYRTIVRAIPSSRFMGGTTSSRLAKFFGLQCIDAFGNLSKQCVEAASEVTEYISDAYKSGNVFLAFPKCINNSEYMRLDNFTRKSLELTQANNDNRKSALLHSIDRTETAQGARMLSRWLMEPLIDIPQINARLDYVEFFMKNQTILKEMKNALSGFPDLERSISRILMDRAGPRDLKCISVALSKAAEIGERISQFPQLSSLRFSFNGAEKIIRTLDGALSDSLPVLARDGGFIKEEYDDELDEIIRAVKDGDLVMRDMQRAYVNETRIPSLKIKKNSVLGYFVEISPNFASKMPYKFTRRQSLATCMRYTSEELVEVANKVYSAESNMRRRELAIFDDIVKMIANKQASIREVASDISFLDVMSSFAQLAIDNNYVRPELVTERVLSIRNGRHPVVENNLKSNGTKFVRNDCEMDENRRVAVLTGPNMGGKSTFLRQNAIIIIMAQIGSFVPADYAKIGVTNRIFSRVGASDDIASGRSTFMVEMTETATILQQATSDSFVILDEIGRGTSTHDGLAIAWAVIEEIANNIGARTLLATHYHEFIKIRDDIPSIKFLTVKVEEWNGKIVFLHKIEDGFADKSYGLHVALLAGFPRHVIDRAKNILKRYNTL